MPPPMRWPPVCLQPGEVGRAPGHGQVERRIGQHERLPRVCRRVEPVAHHLEQPLAQRRRLEDAAVEQDRRRRGGRPRRPCGWRREKRGQVAGDGRVADVGQAHLVQAGAGAAQRLGVARHHREEAVEDDLAAHRRASASVQRAADDLPAAAHDRDGVRGRRRSAPSSASLACRHACVSMPYWAASSRPAPGSLRLDELGQGQVHVVAAQQQVIADRLADEGQFALLLDGLDQAEVAGAAADVHDQAARRPA